MRDSFKPIHRAHRGDYEIRRIPHKEAAPFVREHHYAHGCANTSTEAFGLFRESTLVGAALWMPPTKVAAQSVDPFDWTRTLSLSRLVVAPTEPTNTESLFIGAMLRAINAEQRWTCLVTYADESQGHNGTIYRATNWTYLGRTVPEPRWLDVNGKQVSKLATKTRKASDMRELGHTMVGKYAKHKFARLTPIGLARCFIRMAEAIRERVISEPMKTRAARKKTTTEPTDDDVPVPTFEPEPEETPSPKRYPRTTLNRTDRSKEVRTDLERIVETVWVDDMDSVWEAIKKSLRIGEKRSEHGVVHRALDDSHSLSFDAYRLWLTAQRELKRWELANAPVRAKMWSDAVDAIRADADGKKVEPTNKAIEAKCSTLWPNDWMDHEMKHQELVLTCEAIGRLAKEAGGRPETLGIMLAKLRG